MAQINIQNLTFGYDGASENVFENASFSFDTNWKIGLIGRNGRGKTTLLNLLLGNMEYSGNISRNVHFDYFPYEVRDKKKTAIDILPEIYPEYDLWEVMKKLHDLELDEECLYQPFETLSNGQQTKLLLAVLFTKENKFLLIDEPTNHLDFQSRECVKRFLNKEKGFIVVSHDRDFIDACVDHIISINKNNIEIQKGNFSSWWENRKNQDNFEMNQNQKLKKDIARLEESVAQTQRWSDKVEKTKNGTRIAGLRPDKGAIGHKAAKMAQRSKAIEFRQNKAIEAKSKLLKNIEKQDDLFLNSEHLKDNVLIEVKNLSIFYGEKKIFEGLNFSVENGDRVAICGQNGSGKTSLLKFILGEDIKYSGSIYKSGRLKISYISQKYDWLCETLVDFAKENNIDQTRFLTMLIKLGFSRNLFDANLQDFSEGQKKKVLIAKSLCEEANLYVWDEPLNYIDVISRIQIEELLKDANITLIFVEHDNAFVRNIATKRVQINNSIN